jgi:hypothetical protein
MTIDNNLNKFKNYKLDSNDIISANVFSVAPHQLNFSNVELATKFVTRKITEWVLSMDEKTLNMWFEALETDERQRDESLLTNGPQKTSMKRLPEEEDNLRDIDSEQKKKNKKQKKAYEEKFGDIEVPERFEPQEVKPLKEGDLGELDTFLKYDKSTNSKYSPIVVQPQPGNSVTLITSAKDCYGFVVVQSHYNKNKERAF